MTPQEIDQLLESQRQYFASGATLSVSFRLQMLGKLYRAVRQHREEIAEALETGEGCVCCSSADTLSRRSRAYRSGYGKIITGQLRASIPAASVS